MCRWPETTLSQFTAILQPIITDGLKGPSRCEIQRGAKKKNEERRKSTEIFGCLSFEGGLLPFHGWWLLTDFHQKISQKLYFQPFFDEISTGMWKFCPKSILTYQKWVYLVILVVFCHLDLFRLWLKYCDEKKRKKTKKPEKNEKKAKIFGVPRWR